MCHQLTLAKIIFTQCMFAPKRIADLENRFGKTPVDLAKENNYIDLADLVDGYKSSPRVDGELLTLS